MSDESWIFNICWVIKNKRAWHIFGAQWVEILSEIVFLSFDKIFLIMNTKRLRKYFMKSQRHIKFVFLRRPQKSTKPSPLIWHLLHNVKSTVKISSNFLAFLENMKFNLRNVTSYCLEKCTMKTKKVRDSFPKSSRGSTKKLYVSYN